MASRVWAASRSNVPGAEVVWAANNLVQAAALGHVKGKSIAVLQGGVGALGVATKETAKSIIEVLKMFDENADVIKQNMPQLYQRVGQLARVASLNALGISRRPSYRLGDRDSGGQMVRAIEHGAFQVQGGGIQLVMPNRMRRAAKQWRRLNFGVAPRGRGVHTLYEVRNSNVSLGRIGVVHEPMNNMKMPRGSFKDDSGKTHPYSELRRRVSPDQLFVNQGLKKKKKRRSGVNKGFILTQGFDGKDYLGAGSQVVAFEFGRAVQKLAREITKTRRPTKSVVRTVYV